MPMYAAVGLYPYFHYIHNNQFSYAIACEKLPMQNLEFTAKNYRNVS